ncbi:MAG: hypothetical protein RL597_1253 [Pseudomonadota bacterium]
MTDSSRRRAPQCVATTLGAIAVSVASMVATGQARNDLYADAALQHSADRLQRCLEAQPAPWQLESTLSTDGQLAETVRITRWGGSSQTPCGTVSPSQNACEAPSTLQRVVGLEFVVGEPHPAWSANDRVRLEHLIPKTLTNATGNVRLRPVASRGVSEGNEVLRVRIDYRGASTLQRDVADWIIAPRKVLVTMTLVEDADHGGRTIATRVITANQGLQIKGSHSSTSGSKWMTNVLEKVSATAKTMIEPLGCGTPWLTVATDQNKLWLYSSRYSGLQTGRSVLLVPTADTAFASRWPIARIENLSAEGRADLVLVRGSAELCDVGCRAIPL